MGLNAYVLKDSSLPEGSSSEHRVLLASNPAVVWIQALSPSSDFVLTEPVNRLALSHFLKVEAGVGTSPAAPAVTNRRVSVMSG